MPIIINMKIRKKDMKSFFINFLFFIAKKLYQPLSIGGIK